LGSEAISALRGRAGTSAARDPLNGINIGSFKADELHSASIGCDINEFSSEEKLILG
jgi:hypothetical protein